MLECILFPVEEALLRPVDPHIVLVDVDRDLFDLHITQAPNDKRCRELFEISSHPLDRVRCAQQTTEEAAASDLARCL